MSTAKGAPRKQNAGGGKRKRPVSSNEHSNFIHPAPGTNFAAHNAPSGAAIAPRSHAPISPRSLRPVRQTVITPTLGPTAVGTASNAPALGAKRRRFNLSANVQQ